MLLTYFTFLVSIACSRVQADCKTTPSDARWPSYDACRALNASIDGALVRTVPAGSGCYTNGSFDSAIPCMVAEDGWNTTDFHAELPESVDFPLFANYTCVPPNQTGYVNGSGCTIGALPAYVVNSTDGRAIALAMHWAAERNLRIVVKGTGHEYNGR